MAKDYKKDNTSIYQLVERLDKEVNDREKLLLPEFQRNFIWKIEQTVDLFDSILRGIFIGPFIMSNPKFDLTCREIDKRPRSGKGSRQRIQIINYTKKQFEDNKIEVLLDGQQRATSIYRALYGIDDIYIVFQEKDKLFEIDIENEDDIPLVKLIDGFSHKRIKERFLISIYDIWRTRKKPEKKVLKEVFEPSFNKSKIDDKYKDKFEEYFITVRTEFLNLLKDKTLLSVFLLDMNLEDFCLFFERSNSKGVTLNFIDIIKAKVYRSFNLGAEIEKLRDDNKYPFDDSQLIEAFVRLISFQVKSKVGKKTILSEIDGSHFQIHWNKNIELYKKVYDYLVSQDLLLNYRWIPRNMFIPMMVYVENLPNKAFSQQNKTQKDFFNFWFISSLLNTRYGGGMVGSTNDIIAEDCNLLTYIATNKKIEKEELKRFKIHRFRFSYNIELLKNTMGSGAIFTGIMTILHAKNTLKEWNDGQKISVNTKNLNIHHIFPKKYIEKLFIKQPDAEELYYMNSLLNKAVIDKITNIKIRDNKPSEYLKLLKESNPDLENDLKSHNIPVNIIKGHYDNNYLNFLKDRYKLIDEAIKDYYVKLEDKFVTKN